MHRRIQDLAVYLLALAIWLPVQSGWAIVLIQPPINLKQLGEKTKEAAKLYSGGKMEEAAKLIDEAQRDLALLLSENPSPQFRKVAEPQYQRIARAHGLIEIEGVDIEPLRSWEELISGSTANGEKPISFKDEIAPILVGACLNCHITGNQGRFSMRNYEGLMRGSAAGKVVFPGGSRGSRLVELIESGDMPRGGGQVQPEQLEKLKKWIDQGAKFDGPDSKVSLQVLVRATESAPNENAAKLQSPTGKETVSFARDIAPILQENCTGCHIGGQQASGGLRFDTFNQLLRGGTSGAILVPGSDSESLLVKKIKGLAGNRMPAGGKPPLSDQQIEKISTWIRESAAFDGPRPDASISTVINTAWAKGAKHTELLTRRRDRALEKWKRVLPNDEPSTAQTDELFVVGNLPQFRLDELRDELTKAVNSTKKQFSIPANKPLVNGGIAVFVLKSRYDYSEFGKMTEKRELPRQWLGHWYADPIDVYCVLSGEKSSEAPISSVALQVVCGAYLGSFPEVPAWFAEGVARNLVINNHKKDDARVRTWVQSMADAADRVPSSDALVKGELDEEAGGVVGMAITNAMMSKSNRSRFVALVNRLRDGKSFSDAMEGTYGKTEDFLKGWIGK